MPERTSPIGTAVVDQIPKAFRLESVKSRIVGLALLATLIPSLGMAWISYIQNRAALTDKLIFLDSGGYEISTDRDYASVVDPLSANLGETRNE